MPSSRSTISSAPGPSRPSRSGSAAPIRRRMSSSAPRATAVPRGEMMSSAKKLFVSVVAYKSPDQTLDCLASLEPELRDCFPGSHVIVVDNCSGDGSAEAVEEAVQRLGWEEWAEVIKAPHNGGYAYGNNLAIRSHMDRGESV